MVDSALRRRRRTRSVAAALLAAGGFGMIALGIGPTIADGLGAALGPVPLGGGPAPPEPAPTPPPPASSAPAPETDPPSAAPTTVVTPSPTTGAGSGTASTPDSTVVLPPIDQGGAVVPDPRPVPVGLQISSIDVSQHPINAVGLLDDGALEIPDETEIGWYRYGATAGDPGSTVLAAHVTWNGATGPFFALGTVDPGDGIEITLDDGTRRNYEVVERALYGKDELPRERIWRTTGPETLVLITCGGDFNPDIRSFRENVVVYAVPVG